MKKIILVFVFLLITSNSYAVFGNKDIVKTSYGKYEEIYILNNGLMIQVDLDDLTVEVVYLNETTFETLEYKTMKALRKLTDSLGKKKCFSIKDGYDKCREPKKSQEE